MSNFEKPYKMTCQEAQLLIVPVWANDTGVTEQESNAFEAHITVCPACRSEYEETGQLMPVVKEHWGPISEDTLELMEKAGQSYKPRMTAEEGWKDLCRRCPDLAESTEKPKSSQLFLRIGAVAACLVIGVLSWVVFSNYSSSRQVASLSTPSVKIELVTNTGNIPLPDDQQITSAGQLKTLLINGKHQMVMNVGTELSIAPHNLGCIVKLDKGEIYTEVEHDGKPFIVETMHGRAVITGTIFNIKTDNMQMEMAVAEGSVSFESDKGSVEVAAGHKSLLASNNKPSLPAPCDTRQLTAWATGIELAQQVVTTTSYQSEIDLSLMFGGEPLDLEGIDYDSWIKQKRDWFKRQFPHIFKFKKALAIEGIEVDYPELLVKSGDLWRFSYPEETSTQLIPVSFESMANLASVYDKNKQWLSDNLRISRTLPVPGNAAVSLEAFDMWTKALEEDSNSSSQVGSELLMTYSLHASVYLSETRTLAWLAASKDQIVVTAIEKAELLKLLEQEIKAASGCVNQFKQLFACGDSPNACDEYEYRQLLQGVIVNIKEITSAEGKIAEYEIGK